MCRGGGSTDRKTTHYPWGGHHFGVTGTGRSGTMYVAWLLTELGIPTGHEYVLRDASDLQDPQAWGGSVGASWYGLPTKAPMWDSRWPVALATRHPCRIAASWWKTGVFSGLPGNYSSQTDTPEMEERRQACPAAFSDYPADEIGTCISFTYHWGLFAEDQFKDRTSFARFKVEHLASNPDEVRRLIDHVTPADHEETVGVPAVSEIKEAQTKFGTITNSAQLWAESRRRQDSFESIREVILNHPLYWKIQNLSNHWGYSDDGEEYV